MPNTDQPTRTRRRPPFTTNPRERARTAAQPHQPHNAGPRERALTERDDLACRDHDPELFAYHHGPTGAHQAAQAKQVCRGCPALALCRAVSLELDDQWTIRGGLDPEQRRTIRAQQAGEGGE